MNSAYDPQYARSPEHRRQVRRRVTKKATLVLLLLGLLCLLISVIALLAGLFQPSMQVKLYTFSAGYAGLGVILLIVFGILKLLQGWRHRRRRRKPSHTQEELP